MYLLGLPALGNVEDAAPAFDKAPLGIVDGYGVQKVTGRTEAVLCVPTRIQGRRWNHLRPTVENCLQKTCILSGVKFADRVANQLVAGEAQPVKLGLIHHGIHAGGVDGAAP